MSVFTEDELVNKFSHDFLRALVDGEKTSVKDFMSCHEIIVDILTEFKDELLKEV